MKSNRQVRRRRKRGFTLVEVLVSSALSVLILGVTLQIYIYLLRTWHEVELRMQADSDVNIAMGRMVYGMGERRGLRCAAEPPTITSDGDGGWTLVYRTGGTAAQTNSFTFSRAEGNLTFNPGSLVAGRDLSYAWASVKDQSLIVTLRVDRADGRLQMQHELGTAISFRNSF